MASKGPLLYPTTLPDSATPRATFPSPPSSRPKPLRINTTPHVSVAAQDCALKTPPKMASRSTSASFMRSAQSLATPSPSPPHSKNVMANPDSLPIKEFPARDVDYEILRDKPLGSGRWSNVYLAKALPPSTCSVDSYSISLLTPPPTPTLPAAHRFLSSSQPEFYALKTAANRACIAALRHEAAILTYLSSKPGHRRHIVPFHGYDKRHDALAFTALPTNLESVMVNDLARSNEASRISTLANVLPRMTRSLVSSLVWLHTVGVVHADIKPANILLRPNHSTDTSSDILTSAFTPVLADFTSSFGSKDSAIYSPTTSAVFGGGTYEYLAPELLSRTGPPPSASSDVYALAMTILTLIIGASPFSAAAGNRFQLLEMIKMGTAIEFAMQEHQSERRILDLTMRVKKTSGFDILRFLKKGLRKDPEQRVSAEEWLREFD